MHNEAAGIPTRTISGLAARDIFFEGLNDLNIYVEDEGQEQFYEEVLQRIIPNIKSTQIFPLGGKPNVLAHCSDPVNKVLKTPSIYVVDKDFDDLLGIKVNKDNLFYLQWFCIENYLIDEDAALEVAVETRPKTARHLLIKNLNFKSYVDEAIQSVDRLFRLFLLVQKYDLGIPNTSCKPESFSVKDKPWLIDGDKVSTYQARVFSALTAAGHFNAIEDLEHEVTNLFTDDGYPHSVLSGKFLLAMICHYFKQAIGCGNIEFDSMCYRFAKNGTLKGIEELGIRVKRYLSTLSA